MNYSDYFINLEEYKKYIKDNTVSEKMLDIWNDLLERIEDEMIKQEAKEKGFVLEDNPDLEDDVIAHYLILKISNASNRLQKYIQDKIYNYVVCMKD